MKILSGVYPSTRVPWCGKVSRRFANTRDAQQHGIAIIHQELNLIPHFPCENQVKTGDRVEFTGAIELNQKYLNFSSIEIIPVSLSVEKQ